MDNQWEAAELDRMYVADALPRPPHLMLWALIIGSIAADGGDYTEQTRAWFELQIVTTCDYLSLRRWEDAETILTEVLWNAELEVSSGSLGGEVDAIRRRIL
jgi:hypothetical protein